MNTGRFQRRVQRVIGRLLDATDAAPFTFTRNDGTTRTYTLSAQPYEEDGTTQFDYEGMLNMASDVPFKMMGPGTVNVIDGDKFPMNGMIYEVISVVQPPTSVGTPLYTHILAKRIRKA